MRFPGLGRAILFVSKKIANSNKAKFQKEIKNILHELKFDTPEQSNFEIVSFCGGGGFFDQMKCILSFLKNVGIPSKWFIYSDGAIDEFQLYLLRKFPFVEFRIWDHFYEGEFGNEEIPWTYKKYVAFARHTYGVPSIFCDSDVLFYPKAKGYLNMLKELNYVLPEPPGAVSIDPGFADKGLNGTYNYNAGFFILNQQPDFQKGFAYLQERAFNNINYFADQSALNLVISSQKHLFQPLDPRIFIVTAEDQFSFSDCCDYQKIAIRHFVGPVRHKMWM